MNLLLLLLTATSAPEVAVSYVTDGGFSQDAGKRGQVIDKSEAGDPGADDAQGWVAPKVNVRIIGAEVLPPEVYLEMLRLPAKALPNAATAAQVQKQMLDYLGRTGFQLASVGATVEDGEIVVHLNEGQIERVIFIGQLSFQQVRFKLALSMPANVFNRPQLDRQTRELAAAMGLPGVRWELVRTGEVDHSGPQIEELPQAFDLAMQGAKLLHARRPYEVRIHFPSDARGTGLGVAIKTSNTDGLETGLNNRWGDLFSDGDRFFLAGSGGIGLRPRLDTEKLYFHFSRGYLEARYDTLPLLKRLRPNIWVENDWLNRQRGDLHLESYWAVTVDAAAQLELELGPGLHLLFGAGFEWRRLFGFLEQTGFELSPSVLRYEAIDRKRPLLRLTGEWVVDPTVIRWDRRHVLEGEARQYVPVVGEDGLGWADVRYQTVKEFGWHDLWIKSRGHLSWGDVTFHDELSLGEFTRGLFGDQYVPSALNLSLEFRFSISRDQVKVGLFHDVALFAVPLRGQGTVVPQLANSFGPGLHVLLNDLFQLDTYIAFGFRRGGQFSTAFSLQFQKAF